jgi:hypothetical protein
MTELSGTISALTLSPPSIVLKPSGAVVDACERATFTVTAAGYEPLSYQWFYNDIEIPGATGALLELQLQRRQSLRPE